MPPKRKRATKTKSEVAASADAASEDDVVVARPKRARKKKVVAEAEEPDTKMKTKKPTAKAKAKKGVKATKAAKARKSDLAGTGALPPLPRPGWQQACRVSGVVKMADVTKARNGIHDARLFKIETTKLATEMIRPLLPFLFKVGAQLLGSLRCSRFLLLTSRWFVLSCLPFKFYFSLKDCANIVAEYCLNEKNKEG